MLGNKQETLLEKRLDMVSAVKCLASKRAVKRRRIIWRVLERRREAKVEEYLPLLLVVPLPTPVCFK
jgi:hypothetical protein